MAIDSYRFGNIIIDGQSYGKDVIITHDTVISPWWRKDGHSLIPADLEAIMQNPPSVLIVGTGNFGIMKVPQTTMEHLSSLGIEVRAMRTGKAVDEFNKLSSEQGRGKIAAALHLTC